MTTRVARRPLLVGTQAGGVSKQDAAIPPPDHTTTIVQLVSVRARPAACQLCVGVEYGANKVVVVGKPNRRPPTGTQIGGNRMQEATDLLPGGTNTIALPFTTQPPPVTRQR